jgi:hypothetical protein
MPSSERFSAKQRTKNGWTALMGKCDGSTMHLTLRRSNLRLTTDPKGLALLQLLNAVPLGFLWKINFNILKINCCEIFTSKGEMPPFSVCKVRGKRLPASRTFEDFRGSEFHSTKSTKTSSLRRSFFPIPASTSCVLFLQDTY